MKLEKVVKHMKIAVADRIVPTIYGISAANNLGILYYDKHILQNKDLSQAALTIGMFGTVLFLFGLYKHIMSYLDYAQTKFDLEEHGFIEDIITEKKPRRLAKIYAKESDTIPEFEQALKQYAV